jgi:sensor histidine kinase YesM
MNAHRAQMNPHFIFNSIGAIQHYIIKKDPVLANKYLSRFAKLMRLFLDSSRNNYTSLQKEINLIELYIYVEKLRFEEKFDYTIDVQPNMPTEEIEIPSMLLQPFIENAINHGLMHKTGKGLLYVGFKFSDENSILCTIKDNGVGRKAAGIIQRKNNPEHKSFATKILEERVNAFLVSDNIKITVNITDIYSDNGESNGTSVEIVLPFNKTLQKR